MSTQAESEDDIYGGPLEDLPVISSSESWHDSSEALSSSSEDLDAERVRSESESSESDSEAADYSLSENNKNHVSLRSLLRKNKDLLDVKTSRKSYRRLLGETSQPYSKLELNEKFDFDESDSDGFEFGKPDSEDSGLSESYLDEFDHDESKLDNPNSNILQIGAVRWTHREQAKLFDTLSRKGKDRIQEIAEELQSKSQLEVSEYIKFMEKSVQTSGELLHPTAIPAAVEINKGLEKVLDRFAEYASLREQIKESRKLERKYGRGFWNIDDTSAEKVEEILDSDDTESQSPSPNTSRIFRYAKYLNIKNWIQLSQSLFMNSGKSQPENNWRHPDFRGETPSITAEAFGKFYYLTRDITQRVAEAAILLADDRLAKSQGSKKPKRYVRRADVHTALTIMNMKHNSFDFYVHLPRRLRLDVARKKDVRSDSLSYEKVEELLSRRRRLKNGVDSSGTAPSKQKSDDDDDDDDDDEEEEEEEEGDYDTNRDDYETSEYGNEIASEFEQNDDDVLEKSVDDRDDESNISSPQADDEIPTYSDSDYKEMDESDESEHEHEHEEQEVEEAERHLDEYNAYLDRKASQKENEYLRDLLKCQLMDGLGSVSKTGVEQEEPPEMPSMETIRKNAVADWRSEIVYQAEWETYGRRIQDIEKDIAVNHNKRRRIR